MLYSCKLEIGGSTEHGGTYAPYNGDGTIDYEKIITIRPGEDLPPNSDGWIQLPLKTPPSSVQTEYRSSPRKN